MELPRDTRCKFCCWPPCWLIVTIGGRHITSGIEMNMHTHILTVDGEEVYLPPIQWRILAKLVSMPGQLCSFDQLGEAAWHGPESGFAPVTSIRERLKWHVSQLKPKLGSRADTIQMIHGFGYKYSPED